MAGNNNEIHTVVQGYVGTEVELVHLSGAPKASFRLGSTPRYFDKAQESWSDRPTTWLRVECWRGLAQHVAASLHKGDPVLVRGVLRTSEWEDNAGQRQTRLYLDADMVGHDLNRGTSSFAKADGGRTYVMPYPATAKPSQPVEDGSRDGATAGDGVEQTTAERRVAAEPATEKPADRPGARTAGERAKRPGARTVGGPATDPPAAVA